MSERTGSADFTVAVCTRGRPDKLRATLDALDREGPFPIVVVDQSEVADRGVEGRPGMTAIRDEGRGLSRARNIALGAVDSEWIVFVDDDCLVEAGFATILREELAAHPRADFLSGEVGEHAPRGGDYPPVATFHPSRPGWRAGRWTLPGTIGFGVFFAVRRSTAERLGGWDERLGPGVPDFPAADDADFNYRLLRSGGAAWVTPRVRVRHDQWRSPAELRELHRGYLTAWSGFAMKHLRSGDVAGGLWLWAWGLVDVLDMLASGLGRRSRLRVEIAGAKLRGLGRGTLRGLARSW
jgi:GT2 family glycosyltransferase